MKWIAFFLIAVAAVGVVAAAASGSGSADETSEPIFGIKIPPGTVTGS